MELDRIYNSDCISGMKNLPDDCIDLIVTDPPYLIRYKSGSRKDRSHKFCKEILGDRDYDLIEEYIRQCYRVLKPNSAMYMFCGTQTLPFFQTTAINAGFNYKNTIIWDKKATNKGDLKAAFSHQYEPILLLNKGRCKINGKRINDIWAFPRVPSCRQVHQNQKPTALIEQCINKHSQVGG